jgi:phage N-6-adenine-methyltransferase
MGNALEQNWPIARYYGNPPYSNPEPYVKKTRFESRCGGGIVVLLLPADVSTTWFREHCMKAAEWIIIEGRVKFNNPDGTPMPGSPKFGSIAVVFDRVERDRNGYIKTSLMKWK